MLQDFRFDDGKIIVESIKERIEELKGYYEFIGLNKREAKELKGLIFVMSVLYDDQVTVSQSYFNSLMKSEFVHLKEVKKELKQAKIEENLDDYISNYS